MASYFMGVDNGGTLTKACIFDETGREVGGATAGVPLSFPKPGFTERDMDALWQANCVAIRGAIADAGIQAKDLRGLACTGHGKGLYLWGLYLVYQLVDFSAGDRVQTCRGLIV